MEDSIRVPYQLEFIWSWITEPVTNRFICFFSTSIIVSSESADLFALHHQNWMNECVWRKSMWMCSASREKDCLCVPHLTWVGSMLVGPTLDAFMKQTCYSPDMFPFLSICKLALFLNFYLTLHSLFLCLSVNGSVKWHLNRGIIEFISIAGVNATSPKPLSVWLSSTMAKRRVMRDGQPRWSDPDLNPCHCVGRKGE